MKSIQRAPPRKAKKQAKAIVPKLKGAAIRINVANDKHIAVIKPLNVFQIIGCCCLTFELRGAVRRPA